MKTPRRPRQVTLRGVFRFGVSALCASLALACAPELIPVLEIEGLAFVPSGQIRISVSSIGAKEALLVDRFETTRELWLEFLVDTDRRDWIGWELFQMQAGDRLLNKLPAVGMDWQEAQEYAEWRGMRLPEVPEWLWIAAGPRAQAYPYGTSPADSAANTTELALLGPTPVGTFFNGRTPGDSIYDLEGNVAEWAIGSSGSSSPWVPRNGLMSDGLHRPTWVLGGSFLTHSRPLFKEAAGEIHVNGIELSGRTRANDIGVRPVIEARVWLLENMGLYSDGKFEDRLYRVGQSWGNRSVNLLSELVRDHPDQPMLGWLLEGARAQ